MNFQFITCTGAHNQTSITNRHHNVHNHQSGSNKQHTKNTPTPWLIFTPMERLRSKMISIVQAQHFD